VYDVAIADILNYENTESYLNELIITSSSIIATGGGTPFSIQFPWIRSFGRHENEHIINTVINEAIHELVVAPFNIHEFVHGVKHFRIEYEVAFVNDKYLSIHFFGYEAESWATRDINEAMTFDLNTGRRMSLGNFFTYEEMKDIIYVQLLSDNATLTDKMFNENEAMRDASLTHFHEHFSNSLSNNTLLSATYNFYLREGTIGLIAPPSLSMRQHEVVEIYIGQCWSVVS